MHWACLPCDGGKRGYWLGLQVQTTSTGVSKGADRCIRAALAVQDFHVEASNTGTQRMVRCVAGCALDLCPHALPVCAPPQAASLRGF